MSIHFNADVVLQNAHVITMNNVKPEAEAIAIKNGRFLWVGTNDEVNGLVGKQTKVRDLKGMTVVPGFNEAHNHTMLFGLNLNALDLSSVRSIGGLLDLVKKRSNKVSNDNWIIGLGYNQNEFNEKRHPTRWELDMVAPDHPVAVKHCSAHVQVVNSKALELAGITKDIEDPPNGKIERDAKTGELTGVFFALPAIRLVDNVRPKPSYKTMVNALRSANDKLLEEGTTSAMDAGMGTITLPRYVAAFQEAVDRGFLKVRHNLAIWADKILDFSRLEEELENAEWKMLGMGIRSGLGNEKLRIGPLKLVTDGAFSTGTAATYEPYGADKQNQSTGALIVEPENLKKIASVGHRFGWQLAVHAIGDRAIDNAINAIEKAQNDSPRADARHRIEHCAMVNPRMMTRMKKIGILPILQPGWLWGIGDNWISQLGIERASRTKPFRSLLKNNLVMAFSSDRPVINGAPLLGIHCAVNETTMGGQSYAPDESISVEEALRCYTINGAYTTFEEKDKGSIEEGKLADLVVLGENILTVDKKNIKDIPVISTMVNGEFVYGKYQ